MKKLTINTVVLNLIGGTEPLVIGKITYDTDFSQTTSDSLRILDPFRTPETESRLRTTGLIEEMTYSSN